MQEFVEQFSKSLRSKKHLLQLVQTKDLGILFDTGEDRSFLHFKDGEIVDRESDASKKELVQLQCSREVLNDLLGGRIKLRELSNEIKVKASFRNVLLVESLFYLSKSGS
ncbi:MULTISPECIES: hypothetical protein [unclassified Bacillus (in: firmicutes)]|uniref:hypothetical protein n=1 Tax=unclassified Bacillus (in: firmicutes) TaxID=185979 RepID=UPI0008F3EB7A|nr:MULTISPECIES: hypothetical protein [unclassified Bacillus (in: firmicutes)]SFB12393.1 hypothetical protein SAMN02799634_106101 [Bacillus sp. UNCCL13]SFQ90288.1 hypothetical protein SAMN04488577_3716 [Bacillus sp. cl95]